MKRKRRKKTDTAFLSPYQISNKLQSSTIMYRVPDLSFDCVSSKQDLRFSSCIRFVRIRDSPRRINSRRFDPPPPLVNVFPIGRIKEIDTRKACSNRRHCTLAIDRNWVSSIAAKSLVARCGSCEGRGLIKFNLHSRHLNRSI